MAQQVEGTSDGGENSFINWLKNNNVKPNTINKLIKEYNSVEELEVIEDDDINDICDALELSILEKNKFKYIIKKAKSQSNQYHVCIFVIP